MHLYSLGPGRRRRPLRLRPFRPRRLPFRLLRRRRRLRRRLRRRRRFFLRRLRFLPRLPFSRRLRFLRRRRRFLI